MDFKIRLTHQELQVWWLREYAEYADWIQFDGYEVKFSAYFPYSGFSYAKDKMLGDAKVRVHVRGSELHYRKRAMLERGVLGMNNMTKEKLDKKLTKITKEADEFIIQDRALNIERKEHLQMAKDLVEATFPEIIGSDWTIKKNPRNFYYEVEDGHRNEIFQFTLNYKTGEFSSIKPTFEPPIDESIQLIKNRINGS